MSCNHPFVHHYYDVLSKSDRTVLLPCGKCVNCLKKVQNDWYLRMTWELRRHSQAVFFTLTYDESSVPYSDYCYRTCRKSDVQNWLKLGRELYFKKCGKRFDFKYFICSEYGPRTFRPHYHGIIFGITLNDFKTYFGNKWRSKYGFVTESELWINSQGACRYLSKYCNKGKLFDNSRVLRGFVEKPFRLVSKGFGDNYVSLNSGYHLAYDIDDENEESVSAAVRRSRLFLNGFGYSLPRYYRTKIFGSGQEDLETLPFRRSMYNFVQSKVFDDYNRELELLRSRGFSESDIVQYFKSKEESDLSSERELYKRFVRFYDKSQL